MARLICVASLALAVLVGCEQRFSSTPPAVGPESPAASSSDPLDALWIHGVTDAGTAAADASHALTVTLCSSSPEPCPTTEGAPSEATYHVVFGSGRGVVRSRGQAMADLYKELRDRISSGERLVAEVLARGDGGMPLGLAGGASPKASSDADAISACAFHLLDLVDGAGGVVLDVVHGSGPGGCSVSLGRGPADAGLSRCLVKGPEGAKRTGR